MKWFTLQERYLVAQKCGGLEVELLRRRRHLFLLLADEFRGVFRELRLVDEIEMGKIKRDGAGIIVKCNPNSIYRGIKMVLKNPELAETLAKRSKKMVKDFYNIEHVAEQLIKKINKFKTDSGESGKK